MSLRANADDSHLSWQERKRRAGLLEGLIRDTRQACHALEHDEEINVDIETSGLSPWYDKIATVQLYGVRSGARAVLHPRGDVPQYLMDFLSEERTLNLHNGVGFDILFLANAGLDYWRPTWYDTLVGECTVVSSGRRDIRKSLQASAKRRLGIEIDKDIEHGGWMNPILTDKQLLYAIGDVTKLHLLKQEQLEIAEKHQMMPAIELEMALVPCVVEMTLNGLPFNKRRLLEYLELQRTRAAEARARVNAKAREFDLNPRYTRVTSQTEFFKNGKPKTELVRDPSAPAINLNSSPQKVKFFNLLSDLVYGEDQGPKFSSTAAEVLMEVVQADEDRQALGPWAEDLLIIGHTGQREKVWSEAWANKFAIRHPDRGWEFVHSRFWQAGTDTFRFSSSDPNLQQVAGDMRDIFEAPPGFSFVKGDLAQVEVRVTAAIHHDEAMLAGIEAGTGDLHASLAAQMNGWDVDEVDWEDPVKKEVRKLSKAQSFTLCFGGWWPRLYDYARLQGIKCTEEDAKQWHAQFFNTFKQLNQGKINAFSLAKRARAGGYPVVLRLANSGRRVLVGGECRGTVILNTMVQSTAGIGLKWGILECKKAGLHYNGATVHDELDACVPQPEAEDYARELAHCMVEGLHKVVDVKIGTEAQWGPTWGTKEGKYEYAA